VTTSLNLIASLARLIRLIKTGSLDGVKAMAAYVLDKNGRRWALAFLANHAKAAQSDVAQDALLE